MPLISMLKNGENDMSIQRQLKKKKKVNPSPILTHTCFSYSVQKSCSSSLNFLLLPDPPCDAWPILVSSTLKTHPQTALRFSPASHAWITARASGPASALPASGFPSFSFKAARGILPKPRSTPDPSRGSCLTRPRGQGPMTIWTAPRTPSGLREPTWRASGAPGARLCTGGPLCPDCLSLPL